jgi:hypothetical protein
MFAGAIAIALGETRPVFDGITSRFPVGHRWPDGHVIPDTVSAWTAHRMRVSLAGRHVSVNAFAT